MAKALIIVDVQNDFISGSLPVPGGEEVAIKIANLLDSAANDRDTMKSANFDVVVTTQDWHIDPGDHWSLTPDYVDSWPVHCAHQTEGAELHDEVRQLSNDGYVDAAFFKGYFEAAYSGFEAFDNLMTLHGYLVSKRVTEIHVCGLATDYCVKQTALDGVRLGYDTYFLQQLSAGITPETEAAAIEEMRAAGVHIVD